MNGMEKNYRTEKVFASFFSGYVPFFGVIILYNEEEKGRASMSEKVYINICDRKKCPGPVYAVKAGDTLYSIAQKYHCRVRVLLDLNPFVDIYNLQPGDEICVPDCREQGKVDFRPYVVKEGDTLEIILKNASMTFEELAKVNRILYNLTVPVGTILLVPAKKNK